MLTAAAAMHACMHACMRVHACQQGAQLCKERRCGWQRPPCSAGHLAAAVPAFHARLLQCPALLHCSQPRQPALAAGERCEAGWLQVSDVRRSLVDGWGALTSRGTNVEIINSGHTIQVEWKDSAYAPTVSVAVPGVWQPWCLRPQASMAWMPHTDASVQLHH